MNKEKWRERYMERLRERGNCTHQEAIDILNAGTSCHDYTDNPEDAADEELSLWASDG